MGRTTRIKGISHAIPAEYERLAKEGVESALHRLSLNASSSSSLDPLEAQPLEKKFEIGVPETLQRIKTILQPHWRL